MLYHAVVFVRSVAHKSCALLLGLPKMHIVQYRLFMLSRELMAGILLLVCGKACVLPALLVR